MQLDDLFSMLSYGELSNLAMANSGNGTITEEAQPRIVLYTNEALLRLHTKYVLSQKSLMIELQEGLTNYNLLPAYAVQSYDNTIAQYPFIRDLPEDKFTGDVIKVMSVQNTWGGVRPLNDAKQYFSCFTVAPQVLQVPVCRTDEVISVNYQASHRKLSIDLNGYKTIQLSDTLHGALTAFIAYKVYNSINTQESMVIAQSHLAMFDSICADATEMDVLNMSVSEINTRFEQRGWI